MNPVVVDIQGKYACILTDDGEFLKIKNKNYQIGQRIEYKKELSPNFFSLRNLATTLALVLVVSTGTGVYAYPYGTVSLDVNPSITYTINIFDRVIGVEGVNDEGEVISESLSGLKNKKIEDAISTTIEELQTESYLDEENNLVVVSVNTKSEEHSAKVVVNVETNAPVKESIDVIATIPTKDIIEKAAELNTTPGKVWLAEKALEVMEDEDLDLADLVNEPVKTIMNKTKKALDIVSEITNNSDKKNNQEDKKDNKEEQNKEAEEKLKEEFKKEVKKEIKKEIEKETGVKIESDQELIETIVDIIKEDSSDELQDLKEEIKKVLPEELQDVDLSEIDPSQINLDNLSPKELKDLGIKGLNWWYSRNDKKK